MIWKHDLKLVNLQLFDISLHYFWMDFSTLTSKSRRIINIERNLSEMVFILLTLMQEMVWKNHKEIFEYLTRRPQFVPEI